MIEFGSLPKEMQDKILLREDTDPTFYRFQGEDYTEIFFNTVDMRSDSKKQQSLIASMFGQQGSGKCLAKDTLVRTGAGVRCIGDLRKGDVVYDECGRETNVRKVWVAEKECFDLKFNFVSSVVASKEHRFVTLRGELAVEDIEVGDYLLMSSMRIENKGGEEEYDRAFVYGVFLADGVVNVSKNHCCIVISSNEEKYLNTVARIVRRRFSFHNALVRRASGKGRFVLTLSGKNEVLAFKEVCGQKSGCKIVPNSVFETQEGVRGFLDGYANSDLTCNITMSKKNTHKTEVGFMLKSKFAAMSVLDALHFEGIFPSVRVRVVKSGVWKGNAYYRMTIPAKSVCAFFMKRTWVNEGKRRCMEHVRDLRMNDVIAVRTNDVCVQEVDGSVYAKVIGKSCVGRKECVDIEVDCDSHLFQLAGGLVTHNSWSALALCKMLDPNFKVKDQVYFDYNRLVYERSKLKPGMAVLIDEQSQSYGLDAHRVMIILSGIKEQLRKRSIHLIFCAPVLYEESKSSMYIIETMFIDYEERECVCALKTREGYTLGHVRIPAPDKELDENGYRLLSKEELELYERHKDDHLDKLLGSKSIDEFEERAQNVMKDPVFAAVEKIYKVKLGYVPQNMVVQVINKIFPEYHAGVVPYEIAMRIKLDKELSGEWTVAGISRKKTEKGLKHG
jgi:hypothetical protein